MNHLRDIALKYLLDNKLPLKPETKDKYEEVGTDVGAKKNFGFFIYFEEPTGEEKRMVKTALLTERIGFLKYEAAKIGEGSIKVFDFKKNPDLFKGLFVRLHYGEEFIYGASVWQAYLFGLTKYYKFYFWYSNIRYLREVKNAKKACSVYDNRLRLLELLLNVVAPIKLDTRVNI